MSNTTTIAASRTRNRVLAALVVGALVVTGVVLWLSRGTEQAPYVDPDAAGRLTLCSKDGKAITEGNLDDRPFADVVLGETALRAGVDPTGQVATLFAYQPREGVAASEFSGSAITAATGFVDRAQPATQVTADAWSIGDFVEAFPADYEGFVQLRLFLATPAAGTLNGDPYDTADIKVEGTTWHLVGGGNASCAGARDALAAGNS